MDKILSITSNLLFLGISTPFFSICKGTTFFPIAVVKILGSIINAFVAVRMALKNCEREIYL